MALNLFKCGNCEKAFRSNLALVAHAKVHLGIHKCLFSNGCTGLLKHDANNAKFPEPDGSITPPLVWT